jgi:uncharacterized protein YecE (DUF72 family)
MNILVGTSGFAYKEWKGKFYPKDLPASEMLAYYSQRFRTVELNNTFYRMPQRSAMQALAEEAPTGFMFAVKAPMLITHIKRLSKAADPVAKFFVAVAALGKHLGPVLFGLPPNMKKDAGRLADFLDVLPKRTRVAFEFRHESWFDDEVFGMLRKHKTALCIADADDFTTPFAATTDWGYLRLRRSDYTRPQLKSWAKRIQSQQWANAFVYLKHEGEAKGPQLAGELVELLSE